MLMQESVHNELFHDINSYVYSSCLGIICDYIDMPLSAIYGRSIIYRPVSFQQKTESVAYGIG